MTCLPFDSVSGFKLYAGPCPDFQLDTFKNLQIRTAAILIPYPEHVPISIAYIENRVRRIYCPIPDFGIPPSTKAVYSFIRKIFKTLEKGNVYLHCHAGKGRTGLVVACISILKKGLSGNQAISFTRSLIPGAIETGPQERFIHQFSQDYGSRNAASSLEQKTND